MKAPNLLSVAIFLLLSISWLQAGVVPGRWEKLESQTSGTQLIITLTSGDRMGCTFKSSSPSNLPVMDQNRIARMLPKSGVRKIVSTWSRVNDSVTRGGLIGAAVGALSILPFVVIFRDGGGGKEVALDVLPFAAIGAGPARRSPRVGRAQGASRQDHRRDRQGIRFRCKEDERDRNGYGNTGRIGVRLPGWTPATRG